MDPVTDLLSRLVAVPSVNPMGRPVSGPEYLEGGMTALLTQFFRELGVRHETVGVAPGRENVLAYFEPPGAKTTLLFDAHQDTVPVEGMSIPPFRPDVVGDRLYGRGACDVKGPMAAMLLAFERLVREPPKSCARVVMACTVDEEYTHKGSTRLAEDGPRADLAVVAEPTRLNVINTHKGAVRQDLPAHGRACHSSTPALGDNAVYRMAKVVNALAGHAADLAASRPDPVLGPPSLSVGRIEGGISANVVPDLCEIEIDRRVIPGEIPRECRERVRTHLRDVLSDIDFGSVEFLDPWVNMPALAPRVSEGDLQLVRSAVTEATGRQPEVGGVPYGTDAGPLSAAGLPCLVLGPGDIAQAHTKDEWVDLDEVRLAVDVYYRIATALGERDATDARESRG